jgi:hypothetical protein
VDAYEKLAASYGLRIIPSGAAFQAARALPRWHFKFPDPAFDYEHPAANTLPAQAGSLNVGWYWQEDKATGKPKFNLDFKHANAEGRYLAACVWYEFFFKDDVTANTFVPKGVSAEDAVLLRKVAHDTLAARAH